MLDLVDIRCPKCDKLLAKMSRNGCCKNIYLYCRLCKKQYQFTIKEQTERALEPVEKDVK